MRAILVICSLLLTLSIVSHGQMLLRGDSVLGNEWIDYNKTYHRIDVTEDGLHKINGGDLFANNVDLPSGEKWQLWFMGQEVPIYVSNDEEFGINDLIVFYGHKNRNGLDSLLFINKTNQLNTRYSLITDTSAYYLTSTAEPVLRLSTGAVGPESEGDRLTCFRRRFDIDYNEEFYSSYFWLGTQKVYNSEFNHLAGFASSRRAGFLEFVSPPHHVYLQDSTLRFGLQIASSYNSNVDDLKLRYQLTNDTLDFDTLGSFEIVNKSFDVPLRPSGIYLISISRLDHTFQRFFTASNFWFEYFSTFSLDSGVLQYAVEAENMNVSIPNVNPSHSYFVLDRLNNKFNVLTSSSDTLTYSHTAKKGDYVIQAMETMSSVGKFVTITPRPLVDLLAKNFIIVTSKKLYEQANSPNYIDNYVAWRSSPGGGAYHVELQFIEDLYDMYSYGVRRHPLALNNYSEFIKRQDPDAQLLIIGKGRTYGLTRTANDLSSAENNSFFVPSFGFPPSDPLAISPIGTINPRLSIGRLAVSTMEEVGIYLNNVIQYESMADSVSSTESNWKKKVIHLSGGNELADNIRHIFNDMNARIQGTAYAPEIITFYKNGTIPVDSSQADVIFKEINSGASIVTFFGHSAPTTLGFRIDNEHKYNNAPLHPLFIALGCSAGNYNISGKSVGEVYCLMQNKGFLNLIATTGISAVFNLESAGRLLYEHIGNEGYQLSHGQILNRTIKELGSQASARRQAGQLSLFGDPSIRLFVHDEVDIRIDEQSVNISPNTFTIEQDSIDFTFDIENLGRSPDQPVFTKISRLDPDNNLSVLFESFVALEGYRTPVTIRVGLNREVYEGQNRLMIELDEANLISEQLYSNSESNNTYIHSDDRAGFPIYIPKDGLTAIWPRDQSILPSNEITFVANASDVYNPLIEYHLEIDTSQTFNSPGYQQHQHSTTGGLIEVTPAIEFKNDVVYYWRISPRPDPVTGEFFWTPPQSFIVLPEKEGWNISHYHQFLETRKIGLTLLDNHQWSFTHDFIPIRFGNGVWNSANQDRIGWFEFNHPFANSNSLAWEADNSTLGIIAFDHVNKRMINPAGGLHGSIPVDADKIYFAFENTMNGRDSFINFVEQIIPPHYNILFFTIRRNESDIIDASDWGLDSIRNNGTNIFNLLERYGAEDIRQIKANAQINYLSLFSKNQGQQFEEAVSNNQISTVDFNIKNWQNHGTISLDNDIIQAKDQKILTWEFTAPIDTFDNYHLYSQLPGSSNQNYLSNNSLTGSLQLDQLGDTVQYLSEFFAELSDNWIQDPMPTQSSYFRIYGNIVGDYAIGSEEGNQQLKNIYQANEPILGSVTFYNIHHHEEFLPVRIYATDLATNQEFEIKNETISISSNQNLNFSFEGILTKPGEYILTIEINQDRIFPEATYFNNVLKTPLVIEGDYVSPLLDVTFDDVRIINNQIVSPTPSIKINLTDENKFKLLDDINFLNAQIKQPDGTIYSIENGVNAEYVLPTTTTNNILSLLISGAFEQEGTYTLSVTGRDASANQHNIAYVINFQVFHKNGFGVRLHPNPVVDALYIDYVLLGADKTGVMKFSIVNKKGQSVANTTFQLNAGQHKERIIIPDTWPPGSYHYSLEILGEDGRIIPEYTDLSIGFDVDGRQGQFILLGRKN